MTQPEARAGLIEYPSAFPIKVMGAHVDGFTEAIVAVAQQFDPQFDAASVEARPSKGGNYLGLTITITATSRAQLDGLYRSLSSHPMVRYVL
jgi:putative lipoic acid-binding regulatory protein